LEVGVGLVLAVLAVLGVAMAVDHGLAGAHLAVGLGLTACLAGIARAQGLTAAGLGRGALWAVLVVVPVGTVLPEELAFRGVLLALLGRGHDPRTSTAVSSALFGSGTSRRR
jgi:membrane protease YdiL (CAAX protease family)